ncbi:MAG: B12-binding domain-containing radical SAM protein [Nitrospirae bacterium]|nr:B12-binding domain-containing radical SAM protein [Nitrospirota bacterium]MBF0540201.1 B12-binding domain-containing radical SAM protein [Nitrospirota bacterium]
MILINSSSRNALKIFQPFLPVFLPIGIGCLSAALEQEGIDVKIIDEQLETDVIEKIALYVKDMSSPYIFGFSVLTASYKNAVDLSQKLKNIYPDCIICFGGPHPSAIPEESLMNKDVDVVIRGEGEKILPEFYRLIKAHQDYKGLDGISYKSDGKIIHNNPSNKLIDIDLLPAFPYHKFNNKKYDLGFVLSSRGCPYKCIFCSNRVTTGQKYRYRKAESIVNDLNLLYNKYDRRYILFIDDNLLVNKKRIYELISEIKKAGLDKKMTFNFQARGDNVSLELLTDMYEAGFRSVFFGMETASEEIMKLINKGETVEQCVKAAVMAKDIGFHVSATFIFGLPGETHKDRMDSALLSKKLKLDMVRFNNATPYPGTALYELAVKEKRLYKQGDYDNFLSVSTFVENPFNPIPFSYIPEGNTEDEIRNDILFSYLIFYLNYDKLKSIFKSPDKGVAWFNAGEKILELLKNIPSLFILSILMSIKFGKLLFNILFQNNTSISRIEFFKILISSIKT